MIAWHRLLALTGLIFAPTILAADQPDFAAFVEKSVSNYIVPAHKQLQKATSSLAEAMADLCESPGDDLANAVDAAFDDLLATWAGVEFLRFGPLAKEGRYERFAFWPDPHGTGARQIRRLLAAKDEKLLQPGAVAQQSAAVQGVPALESLLHSGSEALLATEVPDAFRCDLAQRITRNMEQIAEEALAGWTGERNWADLMEDPGPGNPVYLSHKDAATESYRALLIGLEQQHDLRLARALVAPGETGWRRMPYALSGNALPFLVASTKAMKAYVDASGMLDLVKDSESPLEDSVNEKFSSMEWALSSAGTDLKAALAAPRSRERLVYAAVVLASLRNFFRRLAPAAGLTEGFNTLDGD